MERRLWLFNLHSRQDRNGTLYTGSTDSIAVRTSQHKQKLLGGFTAKYGVDRLVWHEMRETREANPEWRDLFDELF